VILVSLIYAIIAGESTGSSVKYKRLESASLRSQACFFSAQAGSVTPPVPAGGTPAWSGDGQGVHRLVDWISYNQSETITPEVNP